MRQSSSMASWAAPLYTALVVAIATVWAAFLAARNDRRDERAKILQDMQILDKLPEETAVCSELRRHIFYRITVLTCEDQLGERSQLQFYRWSLSLSVAAVIGWVAVGHYQDWGYLVLAVIWVAYVLFSIISDRRHRTKLINETVLTRSEERQRELLELLPTRSVVGHRYPAKVPSSLAPPQDRARGRHRRL